MVGDSGTIVIGGPGQIEQVDLGAGSGFQSADRVRLTLENPTDTINALTDALVTAANFPSLTLGRVDLFGPLGGDGDGIADRRDSCPVFANASPTGALGRVRVIDVTFHVLDPGQAMTTLEISFSSAFAANSFVDLTPVQPIGCGSLAVPALGPYGMSALALLLLAMFAQAAHRSRAGRRGG